MPSERWQVPEPSEEALERAFDDVAYLDPGAGSFFRKDFDRAVGVAFKRDLPGIVRAEAAEAMAWFIEEAVPRWQVPIAQKKVAAYLDHRYGPAPSAEGERCNAKSGGVRCGQPAGHSGLHTSKSAVGTAAWGELTDTPPPPTSPSSGAAAPPPPPSATGECLCPPAKMTLRCPTHPTPCTACGCAACQADRAFVRALAERYVGEGCDVPHNCERVTPLGRAARAVTEAR